MSLKNAIKDIMELADKNKKMSIKFSFVYYRLSNYIFKSIFSKC